MTTSPVTPEPTAKAPGTAKAFALYTALRLGVFAVCFVVAAAIVLPSTDGPKATRVLVCALAAAVVSVPISLVVGRGLRAKLTAALLAGREAREQQDRDYDARVRAAREAKRTSPADGA